uniref:Phosphatidic acid phosphatase type 2/haloperoxidase domain-containing protein n=1 Tax=viral metagenome TaxID=1070528 RepID=A0A6C0EDN8_9ZZZZ
MEKLRVIERQVFYYPILALLFFILKVAVTNYDSIKYEFVFYEKDPRYAYPITNNRITDTTLLCISFVLPIGIALIAFVVKKLTLRKDYIILIHIISSICLAIFTTMVFTDVIKHTVSELRPNAFVLGNYAGCGEQVMTCTNTDFGVLGDYSRFYGSSTNVKDARSSFLSGHTSYAFCTATTIIHMSSYFLGNHHYIISIASYLVASYIGITRIIEYEHHIHDVVAGVILGAMISQVIWTETKKQLVKIHQQKYAPAQSLNITPL